MAQAVLGVKLRKNISFVPKKFQEIGLYGHRSLFLCFYCILCLETISIEKVLQLSNISTKLVLTLGATYQVGKPQLIKKRILRFREGRALDEEETGQDLSHRYYWTRFELSWLSSAVGNRRDIPTPCSLFIQKLKPSL